MFSKLKPAIEPKTAAVAGPLLKLDPNIITLSSIIPAILFFVFLFEGFYIAALISTIGFGLDFFDGIVARKKGKVSAFGGLLDSTVDRFTDALLITAFGFAGLVRWEIVIAAFVTAYLTSYIRSRAELASKVKLKFDIGIIERPERILIIALSLLVYTVLPDTEVMGFNVPELGMIVLSAFGLVTIIQRLYAAYYGLKQV
ncbi:MAG: CDP-alcohol phosphatidyltransferase family protein [Candidatus Dojkabacteria bacterium]